MNCNPTAVACQIELIRYSLDNPNAFQVWGFVVAVIAAIGSLAVAIVAAWIAWRSSKTAESANQLARDAQAREDERVSGAAADADLSARFKAGRPGALRAIKIAKALLRDVLDAPSPNDPALVNQPVPLDPKQAKQLADAVELIPISEVSERLSWLVVAAVYPQAYLPNPVGPGLRYRQRQSLQYVVMDLGRFIRRDKTVDEAAEAFARNIADTFDNWRNPPNPAATYAPTMR